MPRVERKVTVQRTTYTSSMIPKRLWAALYDMAVQEGRSGWTGVVADLTTSTTSPSRLVFARFISLKH
jgi:hypothetical protein